MDLRRQVELVRPYAAVIVAACAGSAGLVDAWILAAIGLRETWMGRAPGYNPKGDPFGLGDSGHGFGLWQLDDRTGSDRIARVRRVRREQGDAAALLAMAGEAVSVLISKHAYLTSSRRPVKMDPDVLRRATIAAYNAGESRVYARWMSGQDPDAATTGRDYGAWVLHVAAELRAGAPDLFDGR